MMKRTMQSHNELREILLDLAVEVSAPQPVMDSIRRLDAQELREAADYVIQKIQMETRETIA